MRLRGRTLALLIALAVLAPVAFAQEGEESTDTQAPATQETAADGLNFGMGLGIGAEVIDDVTYQTLSVTPDVAFGKVGVGLDLTLHYRFTLVDGSTSMEIRKEDWVPSAELNFFELYLPKIRYVRYGLKGEPLYAKFGSIEDATLGNGFIMGGYANTLFLPERRIFGLAFDLDGRLFGFPYVGIETFAANLAAFDMFGTRLFVRPLIDLSIPILKNIQFGGTVAADRNPYYHMQIIAPDEPEYQVDTTSIAVIGADFRLPILSNPVLSLATFGDIAFAGKSTGGMLGFGGTLIGFLTYGAQLRILGDNFIPVYFDATYDLYRPTKYQIATADTTVVDGSVGWFASLGTSFLDDKVVFNASLDGPFSPPVRLADGSADPDATANFPHLRTVLVVAEGVVPGFFFDASYDKKSIQSFEDLIDPTDAVIGARINYKTGPAVISLVYNLRYNPALGEFDVTSGLESSITLF
jgi:hypothetical protein